MAKSRILRGTGLVEAALLLVGCSGPDRVFAYGAGATGRAELVARADEAGAAGAATRNVAALDVRSEAGAAGTSQAAGGAPAFTAGAPAFTGGVSSKPDLETGGVSLAAGASARGVPGFEVRSRSVTTATGLAVDFEVCAEGELDGELWYWFAVAVEEVGDELRAEVDYRAPGLVAEASVHEAGAPIMGATLAMVVTVAGRVQACAMLSARVHTATYRPIFAGTEDYSYLEGDGFRPNERVAYYGADGALLWGIVP